MKGNNIVKNYRKKTYDYGQRNPIGGGYIIIPKDVKREDYIEHCYRTQTVFILTEENENIKNVKIDKASLREVIFPDKIDELGSFVVWANFPKHNYPVILGVFGKHNEVSELSETEFSFSKSFKGNKVEVSGNPKDKYLLLSSYSEDGSQIIIQAIDPNSNSLFKVYVKGKINIESDKSVSIKTVDQIEILIGEKKLTISDSQGLVYVDENDQEFRMDEDGVQFTTDNFNIGGDQSQPFVLGDTLQSNVNKEKDALSQLMQAIIEAPVVPLDGGATFKAYLMGKITVINLNRGDYSSILSNLTKSE